MKNLFHLISLIISLFLTKEQILKEHKTNYLMFYIFLFNLCININKVYSKIDNKSE